MDKFKYFLSVSSRVVFSGLFVGTILLLPMIGMMLNIAFGWGTFLFVTFAYLLVELYGRYYFVFNKNIYKDLTKLKIHHDVENNDVWIESNDTIDSIIDIDIVKHVKLDK